MQLLSGPSSQAVIETAQSKPFHVLSDGEQFRNFARLQADGSFQPRMCTLTKNKKCAACARSSGSTVNTIFTELEFFVCDVSVSWQIRCRRKIHTSIHQQKCM